MELLNLRKQLDFLFLVCYTNFIVKRLVKMFGKIKYISDNTAVVEINKDGNLVSNLMNLHVVFESNGDKLLGEVKNVDENTIKIDLSF